MFGVIVASAYLRPNEVVQLIFPPIPLKLKFFAYGYVAFAAFNLFITKGSNQGGDAAHLGGALAGYFFIRRPHLLREFFDIFGNSSKPKKPRRPNRGPSAPSDAEVDRVLDKVRDQGLQSLSDREKRVLAQSTEARRG